MPRLGILALSAATGYVSLSQEIVWMRAVSHLTGGRPTVFAHVLGLFLVGVALGALTGERICEREVTPGSPSVARFTVGMLILSSIVYFLSIPVTLMVRNLSDRLGTIAMFGSVTIVSFVLGGIFPVLCHYAAREGEVAGVTVSRIYLANIIGATLGPLLTGFVLMDRLSTSQIILLLSLGTLFLGCAAFPLASRPRPIVRLLAFTGIGALIVLGYRPLYDHVLEKLQFGKQFASNGPYKYRVENRSGVIGVSAGAPGTPDVIYGGGVYDGRFNTDPVDDSNGIKRAYMIAGLHPEPVHLLEIGLSSASWTRVMANYSPVRRITVVEINPGYMNVVARYPEHATVLRDPKVSIVVDDGRRWLNRHPEALFDMIVQNTSFHWRSNITNLLSEEYLRLCQRHLKTGGVFYYNSTWSEDVPYTAALVFRHVVRYSNFVAASDAPFELTPAQVRTNLLKFMVRERPLFAANDREIQRVLSELSFADLSDKAPQLRVRKGRRRITDDNMATEFKQERWYAPEWSWGALWRRRAALTSRPHLSEGSLAKH